MAPRPVHSCECGTHMWVALTRGYVALFSPEDREKIEGRCWAAKVRPEGRRVYAYGTGSEPMHRVIAEYPTGLETDHINHIGLDNQRGNLRPATPTQNQYNCRKRARTTSRFKGVSFYARHSLWAAKIYVKGRAKHLGYFPTEEAASRAYEDARRGIVRFEPALAA